jgi:hypothetical protein
VGNKGGVDLPLNLEVIGHEVSVECMSFSIPDPESQLTSANGIRVDEPLQALELENVAAPTEWPVWSKP